MVRRPKGVSNHRGTPLTELDLTGWTIAFDLDGTLVDSAPDLIGALNAVLAEHNLPPVAVEEARHMVGHGARAMMEKGFAAAGRVFPADQGPALVERFIELYLPIIARETRPFEGCLETLQTLLDAGATLVVCTNKRTGLSNALLKALDMERYFAAVVGADELALMVGDSRTDLGAARNAGIPVALFSFGYSDVPQSQLGADAVLDHYDQLIAWIAERTGQ